jgi:pilus assembly protein CpaF
LAVDGPCLTIRRFGTRAVPLVELAPAPVDHLLGWAVRSRANVLVVGATGSGKTTLLNALAAELPPAERVITVEDAAELRLPSAHVVRLETRPASAEGTPAVTARELVRNALRMRPDRLVIGEVRGGEALDLVQAMNTGHNGSLSTLHANGCHDALHRLETLVLLAGVGLPLDAVRAHLAAAVDLVVHVGRSGEGRRVVTAVGEPVPVGPGGVGGVVPGVRLLVDGGRPVGDPVRPARDRSHPWPGW